VRLVSVFEKDGQEKAYCQKGQNEENAVENDVIAGAMMSKKAQTVLAAARTVFLTHGFSAATTDMIQQEAGVSKSTVYAHYATKEALFIDVIETECASFMETVQHIRFRPGGLRETLSRMARAYLKIVLSPTGLALFRVVIAEAGRFPQLAATFYEVGPRIMNGKVAELFSHAVASGELRLGEVDTATAAGMFVGLVRGEAQLQCLTHIDAAPTQRQLERWVNTAVTTFLRAYGANDHSD